MAEQDDLNRNIRRSVGIWALKKIRGVVDEFEQEEAAQRRFSRWIVISILVASAITAVLFVRWLVSEPSGSAAFSEQVSKPAQGARKLHVGSGRLSDPDLNRYVAEWGENVQRRLNER